MSTTTVVFAIDTPTAPFTPKTPREQLGRATMEAAKRLARRVKFYVFINAFILGVAVACFAAVGAVGDPLWRWPVVYGASLLRILAVVRWFEWIQTRKHRILGEKRVTLTAAQRGAIYGRILWLVVPTECVSFWFAEWFRRSALQESLELHPNDGPLHIVTAFLFEFALFIPKSLCFELVFDLFHFAAHWYCHQNAWLYQHVHKRHHLHQHPCALSTYEQDAFDLCLTNVAPFCLATLLSPPLSVLQLQMLFAYKTYVEVAGHSGLEIKGFSFPQMPLVHTVTSICLRVHDHDLHHTHPRWNFAKRFSLWDRMFRTFRPGRPLAE